MMASEGAELSDLNSFTVVQSWTEPELNPVFSEYKEVYVPIPSTFAGQNIYLAFVMEGDEADRWLVDNVSFASYCIPPDNLSVSAITLESATFTWSANNASQWEIEVLPLGAAPTGEGVIVDENIYTATELDMGEYRFYVRAICSEALQSSWSGPFYFDILNGFDGVVSYDSDGDEVCDSFIENTEVIITIGSEQYSVYTNNQGYYSFYGILDAVATVSVQINAPNGFSDVPVYEDTFDFTSDEDFAVDFCLEQPEAVTDLSVTLVPVNQARPGFIANYQLLVTNNGSVSIPTATATIEFNDVRLDFDSSPNTSSTLSSDVVSFGLTNLDAYSTQYIPVNFSVLPPPENEGGAFIWFYNNVTVFENESTPADNSSSLEQVMVNSFDPNDITAHEGSVVPLEAMVEWMHYTIRFQNTGTADAINVRIENTLDDNFDWDTFEPLASSHDYTVLRHENVLEFKFNNIHLPDSTTDELGSHGFITYRIKPSTSLTALDTFENTARIYFDFNPAIITNTAITYLSVLGNEEFNAAEFVLYPNPVTERLYIASQSGENIAFAEVYDINGKLCLKQDSLQGSIDVQSLNSGFYIIKLTTETTTVNYKFIKK